MAAQVSSQVDPRDMARTIYTIEGPDFSSVRGMIEDLGDLAGADALDCDAIRHTPWR